MEGHASSCPVAMEREARLQFKRSLVGYLAPSFEIHDRTLTLNGFIKRSNKQPNQQHHQSHVQLDDSDESEGSVVDLGTAGGFTRVNTRGRKEMDRFCDERT